MINTEKITSKQNKQVQLLKKLHLKKYRYELEMFSVENLKIILDALKAGHDCIYIFITEEFIAYEAEAYKFLQDSSRAQCFIITPEINKHCSQLDTPASVIAVYNFLPNTANNKSQVVYLDEINDPGNLGTIMRSALAFNFTDLVLSKNCADIYNSKTINAAKDAIFKLNIICDTNDQWLENNNLPLYVSTLEDAEDLSVVSKPERMCLVLGSESHGVRKKLQALAAKKIKINISTAIESLNVSAAAAILFFHFSELPLLKKRRRV